MLGKTKTDKGDIETIRTDANLNRILAKKAKMQAQGRRVHKKQNAAVKGKPGFLSATRSSAFRGSPAEEDPPSREFKSKDKFSKKKVELENWITNMDTTIPEEPMFKELPLPVHLREPLVTTTRTNFHQIQEDGSSIQTDEQDEQDEQDDYDEILSEKKDGNPLKIDPEKFIQNTT